MKNTILNWIFYFVFLIVSILPSCVPSSTPSSTNQLKFSDIDYAPDVGIVYLQPIPRTNQLRNPITSLGNSFLLEFDLLREEYSYLTAKIIFCNADWTKSVLSDLEFLDQFNEFQINDYTFSQGTQVDYVTYRVSLPAVRKSGNYIVVVYEKGRPVLSRRFMVYESLCGIEANIVRSDQVKLRNTHHQINFSVNYGPLDVIRPNSDIRPVLLQNHNWKTANTQLTPTGIRVDRTTLDYFLFNGENTLPAWNEFRFFDTRTLANRGLSVQAVGKTQRGIEAVLQPEKSRGGLAYSETFHDDLDGNFIRGNQDLYETLDQSEYVLTHFTLESPPVNGDVYIVGRFNNWRFDQPMKYDSANQLYSHTFPLKQGYYNYHYWLKSPNLPVFHFEGSHFQTENEYEILIYYRTPGTVYDQLVGYTTL